jgi:hypothetical protein
MQDQGTCEPIISSNHDGRDATALWTTLLQYGLCIKRALMGGQIYPSGVRDGCSRVSQPYAHIYQQRMKAIELLPSQPRLPPPPPPYPSLSAYRDMARVVFQRAAVLRLRPVRVPLGAVKCVSQIEPPFRTHIFPPRGEHNIKI